MRIVSWLELSRMKMKPLLKPDDYGSFLWTWYRGEDLGLRELRACSKLCRGGFLTPHDGDSGGFSGVFRFPATKLVSSDQIQKCYPEKKYPDFLIVPGFLYFWCPRIYDDYDDGARKEIEHRWSYLAPASRRINTLSKDAVSGLSLDIELAYEARCLRHLLKRKTRLYETWLEYSPGFVWNTLLVLERYLGKGTSIVESFRKFVTEDNKERKARWIEKVHEKSEQARKHNLKELKPPRYDGPDAYWRWCENPWWVQTILLARLMGGQMWPSVLGTLEARYGRVIDWSAA